MYCYISSGQSNFVLSDSNIIYHLPKGILMSSSGCFCPPKTLICWLCFRLFYCTLILLRACYGVQTHLFKCVCTSVSTTGMVDSWILKSNTPQCQIKNSCNWGVEASNGMYFHHFNTSVSNTTDHRAQTTEK